MSQSTFETAMPAGLRLIRCSADYQDSPSDDRPEPFQSSPYLNLWLTVDFERSAERALPIEDAYLLSWSVRLFLFNRTVRSLGRIYEPEIGQEIKPGRQEGQFNFRLSLTDAVVEELRGLGSEEARGQLELRVTLIENGTARPMEFTGYFEVTVKRAAGNIVALSVGSVGGGTLVIPRARPT